QQALRAGRDVLERINAVVPPSRSEIGEADIAALYQSFHEPQGRILTATAALLAPASGGLDPQFERDVRRIRSSAERLLTIELPQDRGASRLAITCEHPTTEYHGPIGPTAHILVVDDVEDNRPVL